MLLRVTSIDNRKYPKVCDELLRYKNFFFLKTKQNARMMRLTVQQNEHFLEDNLICIPP